MKKIITISREFGAAGTTIGVGVARRLGYQIYDKAIILHGAEDSHVNSHMDVESILKWDEKVQTDFGFAQSLFDIYNKSTSDKLYAAQRDVMRKLAEKGSCVIVGRNANTILKEFDHTLHVFIYGDENWRVDWMKAKRPGETEASIREELRTVDKARKKYCKYYSHTEFGESSNYDICLNVSRLGIETCIDLICQLVQKEEV